jgi:hypothetical protein
MTAELFGLAHLDVRGRRYVLGRTSEVYAVWDGSAGGPPVEVFPLSTDGWTRAWLRYHELESGPEPQAAPASRTPYPLSIGQVVGGAFRLWTRHFLALAGMAAVLVVPAYGAVLALILSEAAFVRTPGGQLETALPVWVEVVNDGALYGIAIPLVAALVVRAGVVALQGIRPTAGDAFRALGRRLGTVLLVAIVGGLAVSGPVLPGFLVLGVVERSGSRAAITLAIVLVVIGLVAAVFLAMRFLLATGVAIVEGRGGLTPLRRSWELVRGQTWRVLGAVLLAALVLVGAALVVVTIVIAVFLAAGGPVTESVLRGVILWTGLTSALLLSAMLPFADLVITLLYVDARVRREDLDLETLARETRVRPSA